MADEIHDTTTTTAAEESAAAENTAATGEAAAGQPPAVLEQHIAAVAKRIDDSEAEASAKYDEMRKELESKLDAARRALDGYEAEASARYDNMRKELESKLDAARQEIIDITLSTEPEPEPKTGYQPGATELFEGLGVDLAEFRKFAEHPYFMYPGKKGSVYVMVPKFYPKFQAGWLLDEVDGVWNRYEINSYSVLFGSVPEDIKKHLNLPKPIPVTVDGDRITFEPEDRKEVRRRLPSHLTDWTDTSARITRDNEFNIIDRILQSGRVPFRPHPVRPEHASGPAPAFELRPYQQEAFNNFLSTGAVGVFHPTGSGKSYVGLSALSRIRVGDRRNLIIVPTRTLISQWRAYIAEHAPHAQERTQIMTYKGSIDYSERFGLVIYDECRALPAHTFARLSTVKTEYRMGLDATPYREDGRNHLIVTLTGHPQTLNWQSYMRTWGPGYHAVNVHIVKRQLDKMHKAKELYDPRRRTMFYSFHIDPGKKLADKLGLPFISASTENRLAVIEESRSFVCSSVLGEGVSIADLDDIVEIDFLFGSRREEMQLSGRLMHSKRPNKRHHIIMTEEEFDRYEKRLFSLEGNGFHVKLVGG